MRGGYRAHVADVGPMKNNESCHQKTRNGTAENLNTQQHYNILSAGNPSFIPVNRMGQCCFFPHSENILTKKDLLGKRKSRQNPDG